MHHVNADPCQDERLELGQSGAQDLDSSINGVLLRSEDLRHSESGQQSCGLLFGFFCV